MSGQDFSKFQRAQELIKEFNLEEKVDNIIWLRFNKHEAAVLIAEMHQMCKAGLSDHVNLRKRSKNAANYYYRSVGSFIHVFAKEQAWAELRLTNQDVSYLFRHISILGGGVQYVQMDLENTTGI